jgi:uncharacterized protein
MRFNVSQLLKQPTGATKHYDIDEPSEINDPDLEIAGPISGRVDLLRTHRGILVSADLMQTVRLQCARCLVDMDVPLRIEFEEEYLPVIDLKTGAQIASDDESEEEDLSRLDEHHTLDLNEVARQELLVALPPHPLHSEDCKGLCPQCGADRNVEDCDCEPEPADPRWTTLADFYPEST